MRSMVLSLALAAAMAVAQAVATDEKAKADEKPSPAALGQMQALLDTCSQANPEGALTYEKQREQLVHDFYANKAQVNPLKYKDVIVNLKALIHGMRYVR